MRVYVNIVIVPYGFFKYDQQIQQIVFLIKLTYKTIQQIGYLKQLLYNKHKKLYY